MDPSPALRAKLSCGFTTCPGARQPSSILRMLEHWRSSRSSARDPGSGVGISSAQRSTKRVPLRSVSDPSSPTLRSYGVHTRCWRPRCFPCRLRFRKWSSSLSGDARVSLAVPRSRVRHRRRRRVAGAIGGTAPPAPRVPARAACSGGQGRSCVRHRDRSRGSAVIDELGAPAVPH